MKSFWFGRTLEGMLSPRRCDDEETPPCSIVPAGSHELLEVNFSRVSQSLLDDVERDLSEMQPTTDTVLVAVPKASSVPVRNRFGVLDEDAVLRPSRRLVLGPMMGSGTGDDDFSTHVEQEGPDQFDVTLEDTDGELSPHQGGDGQATAERAPPGIVC